MSEIFVDLGKVTAPSGVLVLGMAGWHHPLRAGSVDVGGCQMLGIEWDEGDHSIRHRGERDADQVYPVTLEADQAGTMVMRWTIPPYDGEL
ncbi:hypothetical protein [Streptomyces sp. GMY02]|uniref:hypothetical protein n=1 Tax=Streptomyces sp. GMY02 TaxID=1333528 RepID=UPI0020B756B4|nr:hypothetical protein [Streptomyces sp. GMY02]